MIITQNSKNLLNKYYNKEQISSLYEKSPEINDYKKIQASIISNDLKELIKELKNGINPNSQNNFGETPLFLCLNLDNLEAFKILLNYNSNCNIQRNDGNSPLHIAINENKINFVNILLDNEANPNIINKNKNQTPFHLAIINKVNEQILLKLKENGADRYIKDKFNKTPFDYAIETKDNNYILLFNKIFEQKEIILINKESFDKSKDKFNMNPNKFKYLPKHSNKRNLIIKDNIENIDCSNFNGETNTNSKTFSDIHSINDYYNITTKNKISSIQNTIREIKINELKDFSLSDSNFKSLKEEKKPSEENSIEEDISKRKCQTFVDSDSEEVLKKIILDTVKKLKLNNSQTFQKSSEKKYFTKNLFKEKKFHSSENTINKNSTTIENSKKIATLNSSRNNIISGASSILEEKELNSEKNINKRLTDNYNKGFNKASNNIIILKDDSSDYYSNYDSLLYNQEKSNNNDNKNINKENKKSNKNFPNMKYMIMKQLKEKNKKSEIGSPIKISNKILSQLRNWLISCDLLSYYNSFVEKGIVDIDEIIKEVKLNKNKLNYKFAEDIGIKKPGHIIRFLLKLQIDSEILDKNLCDLILEKYCNNNLSTFILNSSSSGCKCCGVSCFAKAPVGSCDINEFTNYINNNDIFAFLRSKNLFELKDNFIHNGFDQVDYIIIQLFSEFKFNKNFLIEFLHIYHEGDQKRVIKILYEEKEKICKELNIQFDKKEVEDIFSEFKEDEDFLDEKEANCFIF